MATDGRTDDHQDRHGDNVILFPKDWFGSRDELVPFGPSADRQAEQEHARRRLEVAPPEASEPASSAGAVSAADFWTSAAGAVHQAIQTPLAGELKPVPQDDVADEPDASQSQIEPEASVPRNTSVRLSRRSVSGTWLRRGLAAVLAVVMIALVVGKLSSGGSTGHAVAGAHNAPIGGRLVASSDEALTWQTSTVRSAASTRPDAHRAYAKRRHPSKSHHAASHPPAVATTSGGTSSAAGSTAPSESIVTETPSQSVASSTPAESSQSSGAGPLGTGGTVGNNCNPKCQ